MDDTITDKLRAVLFPEDGESAYAILDGASCGELLDHLVELEPEHCCLYPGEVEPDMQVVAPYLVALEGDHPFTKWLLANLPGRPWGIFVHSPADFRAMRKHFRTFLIVKGPEGESLYFRYYDPRVLSAHLPAADAEECESLFGEVTAYHCETPDHEFVSFRRREGALERQRHFSVPQPDPA